MFAKVPPLTPAASDEMVRYEETKRLAELFFASMLANPALSVAPPSQLMGAAWAHAEFMQAESERRRPTE